MRKHRAHPLLILAGAALAAVVALFLFSGCSAAPAPTPPSTVDVPEVEVPEGMEELPEAICEVLDSHGLEDGVNLAFGVGAANGFTRQEVAELIASAILTTCPAHGEELERLVR